MAPTQLSLPVTCIHQLLPGSGCHRQSSSTPITVAWPCPGYPCLTPLSRFSHASVSQNNGRSRAILLSVEEASFSFPCHSCPNTERERVTFFPTCSLFFPIYFHLSLLQSKYKSRGTKQCYQESTSVLYMPTAIEYLFSPEHSQTHSSLPVFGSSFSCPQLCCPQNYSGKSLSQRAHRSGCIKVYYLIFPTIQPL